MKAAMRDSFSKAEADQILKRAAEIEGAEDAKALTVDELRAIASEAGFGAQAVERAIAEARRLTTQPVPTDPVLRSGLLMTRISARRTLRVELGSEQLMQAIRLFQPYREGAVEVRLEEDRLTWRDGKGLLFTVWSGGGVTELQVFVSKVLLRRRRWTTWVRSAADRLAALIQLVGASGFPVPEPRPPTLSPPSLLDAE
jgi:hypothetical protein